METKQARVGQGWTAVKICMMWFDNDPKAGLEKKLQRAAAYYEAKYGQAPTLCYVHPVMLGEGKPVAGALEVRSSGSILPHHFWIGMA
ncbi:MAG: hypothetical protein PHQ40_00300 [Anaerolineaceae bacterium]|nr:hypothetical protein [Anaerolineaceae bacterium]MDD5367496.1 hypothetical protein [Anaerolineaceae bacterium]